MMCMFKGSQTFPFHDQAGLAGQGRELLEGSINTDQRVCRMMDPQRAAKAQVAYCVGL